MLLLTDITLVYSLAVIINEHNQILLLKRNNSTCFNGNYGLVGGKIEPYESARSAAIREIFEEVGIIVELPDIEFAHVMQFIGTEQEQCIAFFFIIKIWQGEPFNKEPSKHDHLKWFELHEVPDSLIPRHKLALECIKQKIYYSENNF